jgi:hypothetical protein
MIGHEQVKAAVRDYLETWMPIRLELVRQLLNVDGPVDPASYRIADELPQNDPELYPAVVVMSTRTVGFNRRQAAGGEVAVFDVDYEVTVLVAAEHNQFADDETAVAYRDRLLLALRECVLMPGSLGDHVQFLSTPPEEITGAASQTLRGNALAAGQITFLVRATEPLMPTAALVTIVGGDIDVRATDTRGSLFPWTYAEDDQPYTGFRNYDGSIPE